MLEHDKDLDEYLLNKNTETTSEVKSAEQNNNNVDTTVASNALQTMNENTSIEEFKVATLTNITQSIQSGNIDVDDGLKQFVNAVAIINAVNDEDVSKELTNNAAKMLKKSSKAGVYKDDTKKLEKRTERNEAFYKAFRPILEFDLSHLIGKKRKKIVTKDPQTGKKTTTYEDVADSEPKTYKDRSYGLCLMMLMIGLFIIPYCVANIILAVFNAINALFECFTKFGKTAFYLCTSIAGIAIIGLVIYVILLIIQAAFGVQIFA